MSEHALRSLQAFFLNYDKKIRSCKHKSIFASPPGNEDFIHEYCYCGHTNKIHLSPELYNDIKLNSSLKEFDVTIKDQKMSKLFGIDVVVDKKK